MRTRARLTAWIATAVFAMLMPSAATAAGPLTQRCTNADHGFAVSFPSDWFTNPTSEIQSGQGTVAACTLFAPFSDFAIQPEVANVPILLKHETGPLPTDGMPITVDGRTGTLVETEVNGQAWYVYYVAINAEARFAGFAFDNGSAPFEESRSVLDAMIDTVNLDGDSLPDVAMPAPAHHLPISTLVGLVFIVAAVRFAHASRQPVAEASAIRRRNRQ